MDHLSRAVNGTCAPMCVGREKVAGGGGVEARACKAEGEGEGDGEAAVASSTVKMAGG